MILVNYELVEKISDPHLPRTQDGEHVKRLARTPALPFTLSQQQIALCAVQQNAALRDKLHGILAQGEP